MSAPRVAEGGELEMMPDEVYCLTHGAIHREGDTDPYGYGDGPECEPADWRRVYWRTRKGDWRE